MCIEHHMKSKEEFLSQRTYSLDTDRGKHIPFWFHVYLSYCKERGFSLLSWCQTLHGKGEFSEGF